MIMMMIMVLMMVFDGAILYILSQSLTYDDVIDMLDVDEITYIT